MKYLSNLVFAFFIFLSPQILSAQWINPNGFNDGAVMDFHTYSFTISGNDMYAGTFSGLLRSTDNGVSWTCLNDRSKFESTRKLIVFDSLLLALNQHSIYRSTDGGVEWELATSGITGSAVLSLVLSDAVLYAASDKGVFVSTNRGETWSTISSNLPDIFGIRSLAVFGSRIFVSGTVGTYLTTNRASTWNKADSTISEVTNILSCTSIADTFFICPENEGGVYRSTDSGATWSATSGLSNKSVRTIISHGSNLLAGTSWGLFLSTDRGISWIETYDGLESRNIASLAVSGSDIYAVSNTVFRSSDGGASWAPQNPALNTLGTRPLAVSAGKLLAADYSSIHFSTDIGSSWDKIEPSQLSSGINVILLSGNDLFVATNTRGILISTDDGHNWTERNTGLSSKDIGTLTISGTRMYAAINNQGDSGIFVSSDKGSSWRRIKYGPDMYNGGVVGIAVINTHLFVVNGHSDILHSSDNGTSWSKSEYEYNYALCGYTKDVQVMGNDLFTATANGVFRSTDYGATWMNMSSTLADHYIWTLFVHGTNLFATTRNGIYLTTDKGKNWIDVNSGFPSIKPSGFAVVDDYLVCGAVSTLWRRPLSEIITPSSVRGSTELPKNVLIESNFPNPFSATTTLPYSLSSSGYVTMRILDVAGITMKTVMSDEFVSEGKHEVSLDGSHLPNGTYFVEIVFKDASGNLSREIQAVTLMR
jgi:photosystem II stability/assembly factor-like uncharacterized protein